MTTTRENRRPDREIAPRRKGNAYFRGANFNEFIAGTEKERKKEKRKKKCTPENWVPRVQQRKARINAKRVSPFSTVTRVAQLARKRIFFNYPPFRNGLIPLAVRVLLISAGYAFFPAFFIGWVFFFFFSPFFLLVARASIHSRAFRSFCFSPHSTTTSPPPPPPAPPSFFRHGYISLPVTDGVLVLPSVSVSLARGQFFSSLLSSPRAYNTCVHTRVHTRVHSTSSFCVRALIFACRGQPAKNTVGEA